MQHSWKWAVSALTLLCLLSVGACRKPPVPQSTPQLAIEAFYQHRIRSNFEGTPSADELSDLTPYISVELHDLLAEALRKHQRIASRTVQKRRSFSEGDMFSSLFDGPTDFDTGSSEARAGDEHLVDVRLTSARQFPALKWTDKVRVVRENGHYVVADIHYANHWSFGSNATLVKSLRNAVGKKV